MVGFGSTSNTCLNANFYFLRADYLLYHLSNIPGNIILSERVEKDVVWHFSDNSYVRAVFFHPEPSQDPPAVCPGAFLVPAGLPPDILTYWYC